MSQQALADAAQISKPYVSQIETRNRADTADVLATLAEALGVQMELLRGAAALTTGSGLRGEKSRARVRPRRYAQQKKPQNIAVPGLSVWCGWQELNPRPLGS
ncbi:helix-turn-helix domain-containing protein [Xylophilus ampelinus]|nr:helix-turn-helix domain-containing protein [Xylophilus ampelinus]